MGIEPTTSGFDQIRRSWIRFPPRSKDFFFTSCGSLIPFTRANAQWVTSWVQFSTLNYTSELILCSTICVHSATRHNIHMNYSWFVVCGVNENQLKLVSQRILPDKDHWNRVLPKLHKFWRICVLPEVLGRWYTRRENVTVDGALLADAVCYCRQETVQETVDCCNPNCPIQRFHLSCLGIDAIPITRYCPNCRALPKFERRL